jgi:hypothetical protein
MGNELLSISSERKQDPFFRKPENLLFSSIHTNLRKDNFPLGSLKIANWPLPILH